MDDIEQLRQELALAKAWGLAAFRAAYPTKSPAIHAPARTEKRTPLQACRGVDPNTPWRDVPVVALDVETTGVDATVDRVIEIALVSAGEEWSTLINPGVPIPPSATAVHGIGDADVASAPTFAEAWALAGARGLLDLHPLAYHAPFDQGFIATELVRAGDHVAACHWMDAEWLDACVAIKDVDKFAKGKKLLDACERRGIVIENAHRALSDAKATLAVWRTLDPWCERAPGTGSLAEILRHTKNRRAAQEADFAAWQARQQRGSGRAA